MSFQSLKMDLWTQPRGIQSPENTTALFQVYYTIKDPIRLYAKGAFNSGGGDAFAGDESVEYTVDHCRDIQAFDSNRGSKN